MEFFGIEVKKKKKLGGLDVYEEEQQPSIKENRESGIKKLWNKTVFPEMIKSKKEEKKIRRKIRTEARKEALAEMKPELIEQIKKEELEKMKKKKKSGNVLSKIGKEFASMGSAAQSKDIGAMMGMGGGQKQQNTNMGGSPVSDDKISKILGNAGGHSGVDKSDNENLSLGGLASEEKIQSMMGMGNREASGSPGPRKGKKKSRKKKGKQVQQPRQETAEEKIKRMLG